MFCGEYIENCTAPLELGYTLRTAFARDQHTDDLFIQPCTLPPFPEMFLTLAVTELTVSEQ